MTNENEDVELEDLGDEPEDTDTTDWKAEAEKARGIAQRAKTKLEKLKAQAKAEVKTKEAEPVKRGELDRLDKLFLRSEGIKSASEMEFVQNMIEETGKTVEQLLDSKYFQSQLKELREEKATKDATPSGTKRSGQSSNNEVDYWLAKGEMPPATAENWQLRSDIVKAKSTKAKNNKTFTDNPVV